MKQLKQLKGILLPSHNKRVNRWYAVFFILLLSLIGVGTAYAEVTFSGYTGPQWVNPPPGYRFTANVVAWTIPQTQVCLVYSVNSGSEKAETCTCTSEACDPVTHLGNWVCTIPNVYYNSVISWDISAYEDSCANGKSLGYQGSFSTGPTSIVLKTFTTENATAVSFSRSSILVIASGVGCILLALLWRRRKGKPQRADR